MCLYIKRFTVRKIAKTDITVYKVLNEFDTYYKTPFQRTIVEIGKTYYSDIKRNLFSNKINVGLHSFVELYGTYWLLKNKYNDRVVVSCIIPKGSVYYVGYMKSSLTTVEKAIVSDTIRYDKII
jgi:hypothetical protein